MDVAIDFIGIFVAIFALYKVIVDVFLAKSTKRRDEYAFTKEFLDDLDQESIHPMLVEKGFLALSGLVLEEPEIRYLVAQQNPSTLIDLRRNVSGFLSFNADKLRHEWKGKYQWALWQKHGSKLYVSLYAVLAFAGLVPLIATTQSILTSVPMLIFSVSFLIAAIYYLNKHENIKQAYAFMEKLDR